MEIRSLKQGIKKVIHKTLEIHSQQFKLIILCRPALKIFLKLVLTAYEKSQQYIFNFAKRHFG